MRTSQYICLGLLLGTSPAQPLPNAALWKNTLAATRPPEVPSLAAKWIKEAAPSERSSATIVIVGAAVEMNPAAAPLLVGTISSAVPEMASVAAATAAAKQAAQAEVICKAATAAAPAMATNIVETLCKTLPDQYRLIAVAAADVVPTHGSDILRSVGCARPALRPQIEQQLIKYGRTTPSVTLILDRVQGAYTNGLKVNSEQIARPLALDAGASANPKGGHPNSGDNGWHGGRNYAKP